MSMTQEILLGLSDERQDRVLGWLLRMGLLFRLPAVGPEPFPALVIIQGNDTVKEWLVAFEDLALARGIATLTVDQPGWGESGLTGNRLTSPADLRTCSPLSVDFLQGRREIRGDAIGIFGASLGGLLALYCAGLEPRFAAVAGIGMSLIGFRNA